MHAPTTAGPGWLEARNKGPRADPPRDDGRALLPRRMCGSGEPDQKQGAGTATRNSDRETGISTGGFSAYATSLFRGSYAD